MELNETFYTFDKRRNKFHDYTALPTATHDPYNILILYNFEGVFSKNYYCWLEILHF